MYKRIYFLILNNKFSSGKIFIRNKALPVCLDCVHFVKHSNNYSNDPFLRNERYGRCTKFGEVDMITGTIEYDLASTCRLNDSKCGKSGSEFTKIIKY